MLLSGRVLPVAAMLVRFVRCLWLLIKLVCFGFFIPAEVLTALLTCITKLDIATFLQNAISLLVLNHMLSRALHCI